MSAERGGRAESNWELAAGIALGAAVVGLAGWTIGAVEEARHSRQEAELARDLALLAERQLLEARWEEVRELRDLMEERILQRLGQ